MPQLQTTDYDRTDVTFYKPNNENYLYGFFDKINDGITLTHRHFPNIYTTNPPKMLTIRFALPADSQLVFQFIQELAEYEHLSDTVFVTKEILFDWIFSGKIRVFIAEVDGQPAGFAIVYDTFATFSGQSGIYIEDLFVRPTFRRQGIGTQLFREIAALARSQNCCRIDWMVLDWNVKSIEFYRNLGGVSVDNWLTYRLKDEALVRLAKS
jgi:GNAT superfamily N-acetyltransferase